MKSLEALLSSAKAAAKSSDVSKMNKNKRRYPYAWRKSADALVLIIHLTHCCNCHREHRSPNKELLTRFGSTQTLGFEGPLMYLKGTKDHKRLPREILIYRHYCAFCEDCFEADTVSDLNIYYDKRWGADKINPAYFRDNPEFEDEASKEDSEDQLGEDDDKSKEEKVL